MLRLAPILFFLASFNAFAGVYKCPGHDGVPVYQPKPCPQGVDTGINAEPEPDVVYIPPPPDRLGYGGAAPPRDEHGRIVRSEAAKDDFKRVNPCPATGARSGPCPGYVIDHVKALACGGVDSPANMQWQTVADAHAKDGWERKGCEIGPGASGRTGIVHSYPAANVPRYGGYPSGTQIGPRGGQFHYSASGRKVYEKH